MSQRLHVPAADLTRWILGTARPSRGMYLRIVDFILDESRRLALPPPVTPPGKPVIRRRKP